MEQYTDYPVKIPGRLESAAVGGIVADAKNIYDIEHQKKQSEINAEIEKVPSEIERIDEALNDRYTKEESYNKTEIDNKESGLQNQVDAIKGGSSKSINTLDTEINGNGGIDERLQTVEQLGTISVGGGDIGIAAASDFEDPTPEQRAKVPTVGAILDITDEHPNAGSDNLVKSGGVEKSYIKMPYQTIPSSLIHNAVVNVGVPSWSVKKYRIESGIIILQGNVYSEGDYYDIAFFSDYDNVTSSANLIAREHLASVTQRFVIPNGTKCVCISCNTTIAPNEIISFSPRDYSFIGEDAKKMYLPTPYEVVSGYVTSAGITGAGGLWETHKYRLEQGRLLLENNIVIGGAALTVGFFNDYDTINSNTFIGSFNESTHDVIIPNGTKCVCISYHPNNAPTEVVNFTPINLENKSLPVESKTVTGYINQFGTISNAGGTWITRVYKYHGGYITINGDNVGTLNVDIAFYSDYDNPNQNNVISVHQRNALTQEFLVPAGAVCFAITTNSKNDNINKVVSFSPNNEQRFIDAENYHKEYIKGNVICKPFSFNGKTATFVGDSITRGFTSGSTVTNENYVKIFSERVGLTPTNRAIGGAAFTEGYNEVLTLQEQLEQAAVNSDFLFVAGGNNDWQLNVTDTDFRQAVTNICDYIKDNFNGTVIFITPINCIKTNNNPLPLDYYISTLIEIVAGYGYNIVCGSYFPFPSKSGVADAVFGDDIHPSELGYKIYAGSLQSVLC